MWPEIYTRLRYLKSIKVLDFQNVLSKSIFVLDFEIYNYPRFQKSIPFLDVTFTNAIGIPPF